MVKFLKKYHKWIGIISVFFILMFAVSGVLLNHRQMISGFEISRKWLPEKYHLKNWNNGAIKGTLPLSADSILMYGASGIWLADSLAEHIRPFDSGIRKGIDNRSFRALVKVGNTVFGIATYELYRLDTKSEEWQNYTEKLPAESSLTDLCAKQDTLFVVSRSHIFKSLPPYESFEEVPLYAATDYSPKVSLFKTMWILHSGEIFGLSGKLVVDMLGIIIIVITVTGLFLTLLRMFIRRRKKKQKEIEKLKNGWKFSLKWHNKLGYGLFVLLLFIVITGTFLRPPLLIPIARAKVSPIPYSTLDSENPWNEKLRTLRYDTFVDRWLLYSSDGFYEFANFKENPKPISKKPPISVMGVTVLEQKTAEIWLVGSFSGLYEWNAETGVVHNAFTGEIHEVKKTFGPPSFDNPINGYSDDFSTGAFAFDYNKGIVAMNKQTEILKMPKILTDAPISLWNTMLELHTGRLYTFLGVFAAFFIFFSGLFFLFILISGYIVYKRRHKKRKKKKRG